MLSLVLWIRGWTAMMERLGAAVTRRSTGIWEVLVVVGIAAAGVLVAAVIALGPWPAPVVGHAPVVRFDPPAVAAPRG
jgi:hypothetical protein